MLFIFHHSPLITLLLLVVVAVEDGAARALVLVDFAQP